MAKSNMASRKHIWDALDKIEGKEVGSSHKALNKERVRQGYKPEGQKGAKSEAIKKKMITLKSGEEWPVGKKIREKKEKPLKSWGDEFGKRGFVK